MISEFFQTRLGIIREQIISELERKFTTHEFIEKFAKYFEQDYIYFLHHYRHNEAFRTVHGQIAQTLVKNSPVLGIEHIGKVLGRTVFGENEMVECWQRILPK
jgi:hypothetical protein